MEKHITTKFEETNNRQQSINGEFRNELSKIKTSVDKLTGDGPNSLASIISRNVEKKMNEINEANIANKVAAGVVDKMKKK